MLFVFSPVCFLMLVIYVLPYAQQLPASFQPLVNLVPYISIGLGAILAWRFNRSRIFFSLLFLFLIFIAIDMRSGLTETENQVLLLSISLLLPLNILLIGFYKERGIFTQHGLVRFALFAVQGLGVWWLINHKNVSWMPLLETHWLTLSWLVDAQQGISQLSWLLFFSVMFWQIVKIARNPILFESAVLNSLLLIMLILIENPNTLTDSLIFSFSAVLLIIALVQESYGMAYIDELTGLPGRRAMNSTLLSLGNRFSIAMIDIDHFKKFNDTHGHDIGDQVLRMVAQRIGEVTGGGRPARYGGEEFSVIFPGKSVTDVFAHLEVVRQKIEETPFSIRGKDRPKKAPDKGSRKRITKTKQVKVTVSIGVAERSEKNSTPDDVMKAADKALYRAKEKGRNQVCKL